MCISILQTLQSSTSHAWHSTVQTYVKNAKSFPSRKAHKAELISISLALSQTPVDTARPRIWSQCIAWCACLRPSFQWYWLQLHTDGWPGWVDLGDCYIPRWLSLKACRGSSIQVLTGLDVDLLHWWNQRRCQRQIYEWVLSNDDSIQLQTLWELYTE